MRLYSLSVLRVDIAERDSVVGIVASEEKPEKKKEQTNIKLQKHQKYMNGKTGVAGD